MTLAERPSPTSDGAPSDIASGGAADATADGSQEPTGGPDRWGRARRGAIVLIPVAVLALILWMVNLPYFVMGPGPARDVEPLIEIEGEPTYTTDGRLLLTAVNFSQANLYELVGAWIDPVRRVIPESQLIPPGTTRDEERRISRSQMDTSKIDAAVVALTSYAGYPERHGDGVLVESVVEGSPADDRLFAGDLLVAVHGEPLDDVAELRDRIRSAGFGGLLSLTVEAGGETRTVEVVLGRVEGVDGPAMGITPIQNFPFPLVIESGDIGGPSAGLMWTLGLAELLTPADLTDGRTVAGTGAIGLDGTVQPIGGVEEKVVAAERAGASIFFVPVDNAAAARSVAGEITIVPVRTVEEAVDYLERTS